MNQNLTKEQESYFLSLENRKERRKFLLDCLVERQLEISPTLIKTPIKKQHSASDLLWETYGLDTLYKKDFDGKDYTIDAKNKYTEEDMRKCFASSRGMVIDLDCITHRRYVYNNFAHYLKTLTHK